MSDIKDAVIEPPMQRATAIAHPNIALIKYWGKAEQEGNIPATPSLSVTLDRLRSRTRVTFAPELAEDSVVFDGVEQPRGRADGRIIDCLERMRRLSGTRRHARIETDNNFPTAAGLASSASGFAALVTALDHALGLALSPGEKAVQARMASASAARSLFGGFVSLADEEADGWIARPVADASHWPLSVVVAICATARKATSSSEGMRRSARTSPLYERWVESSRSDFADALAAIHRRDFATLAERSEMSCLKMHAVMMSSRPALLYWNGATVECMHAVRSLREDGVAVFFTVDAGAQLKAICLPEAQERVAEALAAVPGVKQVLSTGLGAGARITEERGPARSAAS